jgi:hypothetical protein
MMNDADPTMRILKFFLFSLMFSSPGWVLISFAAYAFGRRQYGIAMLHMLLLAEGIALGICLSSLWLFTEARE